VTANRRLQPFRYLHDCSDRFRLERIAGWASHPLESAAFSRRTPIPVVRVTAFEPPGSTEAMRKRSRANKAQNCFLYCPSSDRSDSAIRLYIDEIEEDFLRSD
jgi:hypothetical protein